MAKIHEDILEQIKRYDTIIIHRHQRPDPDAYGSQLGLQAILQASFPEKKIYAVGKEITGLAWIGDGQPLADEIPDSAYKKALVIVCDTANDPRIDDQRWRNGLEIVKIDHHPNVEPYGDWQWVEDEASATSVLIYQFYQALADKGLKMTEKAARYLYIGIIGDTGRFMYSLDKETFDVAGELITYGFDYQKIYNAMTTLSENAVKFSGYVMQHINLLPSGFGYVILKRDVIDSFDLGNAGTSFVVSIPSRIDKVKAWAIFEEQENGDYRVRLRSRSVVINTIAQDFDGGGHPMASGAWAYNEADIQKVIDRVDSALKANQAD
ncbi:bifunctional oligoribonuclease/PAP phosphatase NrnA [Fructobacillus evanidus]|uniref:Hydrolyzes c-di-AMP and oligoRNAs (NrnA) n=1 Tax=Fructobacillus evanidus TaxID=3064281 RepID=A0ABM9MNR0_9LACO|nr:hydrolyzes c-di-AMP and oligoRNAs (NrnA) [Fructobacillus sp. LMG 32999]CAK1221648.1 hydrolyzes c-di-AMP and oligoRNAs (NrnA) [Fructobacillus sp. LMG 32999]CAK1225328.1 hydrolyzes c-di-AMP and oligoRNAs (NrnA) [Fructobacillus sp. LMG 32999]CAK1228893.1 hydrolyzes c-di-AMP and oligoRNAs (NrnA) [Fructobacillus sp. LMG 32999]CAK1229074.1 hydrolyzes c-di-AMP and oligoRNAs (NrnA) [Fructobacillus sp. LMG 32999]